MDRRGGTPALVPNGDPARAVNDEVFYELYTTFDDSGLMRRRFASINDLLIKETDRKYHRPLGPRPEEHPGLSDLDL